MVLIFVCVVFILFLVCRLVFYVFLRSTRCFFSGLALPSLMVFLCCFVRVDVVFFCELLFCLGGFCWLSYLEIENPEKISEAFGFRIMCGVYRPKNVLACPNP